MAEFHPRPSGPSRPSGSDSRSRDRGDSRDSRGGGGDKRRRFQVRKKVCRFCVDKSPFIDYKDVKTLRFFITERGKILPRRISGTCALHQRKLTQSVKRGRHLAILAFVSESFR